MTFIYTELTNGEISIGNGSHSSGLEEGKTYATDLLIIPEFISQFRVTAIKSQTFYYYYSVKSVIIDAKIKILHNDCFAQCHSLTSIRFPSSLEEIGMRVFDDCFELANVTFNGISSLKKIGTRAFNTCKKLSKFLVPTTVNFIGEDAFTEIEVPIILYYCGRRTFTGNIVGKTSNYQVIVPFGGPKKFGSLNTTYGEAHCLMFEQEKKTCRVSRQTFHFILIINFLILA